MEAGEVPRGESAEGAEEVRDRATAEGEDGGEEQDGETEEGRPCQGRGQGVEQLASVAWQPIMEVTELGSCLLGLAGLALLEAAALGAGEALVRSLGYTGHGGLLVWGTGSAYPSFQQGGLPWTSCAKRQKWNEAVEELAQQFPPLHRQF